MDTDTTTTISLTDLIADSFAAEKAIMTAQLAYEAKLNEVVKANGSATFQHEGQWFQIRTRKSLEDGRLMTYLCKLRAEPKTWLKGRPKKADSNALEAMNAAFASIPASEGEDKTTTVIE
jgi:hypothetical protein